ncbi:MAG: ATP-binding protein [Caldimicrobium sp.]|uniref:Mg-protoporphyrin IX chelatase n=1 Tax=Caldimicrobium thiodismutans TaxID=1653476 RepID=A0A2N7PL92_9BACT|nr:MAG: magnesium chelatase ATPase subunit I [Caldimicrobium thiodismutans]
MERENEKSHRLVFPFTAIVDQEELKLALILNVINPLIGGVLIMGEKGTGKSTVVRALADLLPPLEAVNCPFRCAPKGPFCDYCQEKVEKGEPLEIVKIKMEMVELPLGITEDRLLGSIDLEYALITGKKKFEPGLLAKANRNFLYIDEVNLLEDHIVDLLLDSAAMGINRVEREGISFTHPARFVLVGTMNPEEGELRPQFLDRFGLCVEVHSIKDKKLRIEILKRRLAFDSDPEGFIQLWREEQEKLAERILQAKENLLKIEIPEEIYDKIVEITTELQLDGHRGDLTWLKAAIALSAFEGKKEVTKEELKRVGKMVFRHRLKRLPFEDFDKEKERLYELLERI